MVLVLPSLPPPQILQQMDLLRRPSRQPPNSSPPALSLRRTNLRPRHRASISSHSPLPKIQSPSPMGRSSPLIPFPLRTSPPGLRSILRIPRAVPIRSLIPMGNENLPTVIPAPRHPKPELEGSKKSHLISRALLGVFRSVYHLVLLRGLPVPYPPRSSPIRQRRESLQ